METKQKRERYDFDELRRSCEGRWDYIIRALSSFDVSEALDKSPKPVHCPLSDHTNSKKFRFFRNVAEKGNYICTCSQSGEGFKTLMNFNGWDRRTAVREVAMLLKGNEVSLQPASKKARKSIDRKPFNLNKKFAADLATLWSSSVPVKGTIGEIYLENRGIRCELPGANELRFHPHVHYWDNDKNISLGYHPALLTMVRSFDSGLPITIHRTYLDENGNKANLPKPKKLMSSSIEEAISYLGACMRIYPADGTVLAVTEGLETALSVRSAHRRLPVWPLYSATMISKFRVPTDIKTLYVFGDIDVSGTGQVAAAKLAWSLSESETDVFIKLPRTIVSLPEKSLFYSGKFDRAQAALYLGKSGISIGDELVDEDWNDSWVDGPSNLFRSIP